MSTGAKLGDGGLHVTLPMRSDAQEQILANLRQDAPIEVPDAEPTDVSAYAEPTHVSLPPIKPAVDTSFDARFTATASRAGLAYR